MNLTKTEPTQAEIQGAIEHCLFRMPPSPTTQYHVEVWVGQLSILIHAARELEMVKGELETKTIELAEAQQWIDSEPDWKDKYMANYKKVSDSLDLTTRKLDVAIEALEFEVKFNLSRHAQDALKAIEKLK